MLLRSASSPILSSHADLFLEADHECSPHRLILAPQRTPHINSNRGTSVHSAFSDSDAVKSLPRMRRAQSEGDLEGLVCRHASAADESVENPWGLHSNGDFTKMSISEEEESDSTRAGYSTTASSPGREEDSQIKAASTTRGFRMEDGEYYTSSMMSSTGRPLVCNSKGCRPLTDSERLGPMCMASGLGICMGAEQFNNNAGGGRGGSGGGHGGGGGGAGGLSGSFHGDSDMTEAYYQKLLQADPQNPLLLRNYAQYLSEAKHDHKKSEEYYERAILECPSDGEVLSKYAKHVWDVHKDYNRAASYFDQAVKATPDDCYVMASCASFLWQSEDAEESTVIPHSALPALLGVSAGSLSLIASA